MVTTRPHIAPFGTAPDGTAVEVVTLARAGTTVQVMTWGATLLDYRIEGVDFSLILGSARFEDYLGPLCHYGAIVGPVANRIAGGQMPVAGRLLTLDRNEAGRTTLHGGSAALDARNWRVSAVEEDSVTLALTHPDGCGGFPGPVEITARYGLDASGALILDITAETARETCFAPAFHGYWTLDGRADLSGHRLTVAAESYLPVDADKIPAGGPAPVAGTVFDHRQPRPPAATLDHNFCLRPARGPLAPACLFETDRLRLAVETTEPGVQVYTGQQHGIALEPQVWPDSPNRPDFPSAGLRPGETYRQTSRFAVTHKT
ncbi:aldose epimerase family protein [Maritimibacter alkaliphilus]|uniref:aldose epimerase family protein n=1 Tax=Maritimibacter alkaliphilus TaxID=404236 RepID=UPI001C93CAEE|nr:aldose epimerase family protein [Maritimibacter alkaliphilus]MBY6091748.1 galactose mutarotase [Maritimibacter alkaliphilus]